MMIWQMASVMVLTTFLMTTLLQFQWGENLELMYDRVLRYPDRVRNLYFTFLFVLRAVTKVSIVAMYPSCHNPICISQFV